eukprot:gene634-439_t
MVVASVLSKNSTITCLDLGFCSISDVGVEALSQALVYNTSLKVLYLSGNCITEAGYKHLGTALSANRSLEGLYLTGNSGKAEGAKSVAKGLKYNQTLNKLFLNGNKIEKDGASSISDTLMSNHSVTHLNLSDNNIGDDGLGSLAEALAQHRKLKELELSFNKITSVGMSSFVDCLVGYRSLYRLLLDNNKLGDSGAKALALALPHMMLGVLNIGFNEISTEGLLAIVRYLATPDNTLASLCLSGNTLDNTVAKELANILIVNTQLQELSQFAISPVVIPEANAVSSTPAAVSSNVATGTATTPSAAAAGGLIGTTMVPGPIPLGGTVVPSVSSTQAFVAVPSAPAPPTASTPTPMSSSSTTTVQQPLGPSGTTDMTGTTQVLVPTAANLAQLGRSQPSATYGQWRMGNTTTPASGTTYPIHSTVHGAMTATATDDDAISDTGTQTTAGHVHERSEEDDEGDASSSRPWKRASNLTTMPRINYFGRIKSLLDELRSAGSHGACLALLRQLRMLEISLLGLDALEIEEILLRDVLGLGRVVYHVPHPTLGATTPVGTPGAMTPPNIINHNMSYQNKYNYNYSNYLPARPKQPAVVPPTHFQLG